MEMLNMKSLYYFFCALSVFIFCFIIFAIYSFVTTLFYIYTVGGLSPLNYGEVTGHLIIIFFALGCFLFSIKTALKFNKR